MGIKEDTAAALCERAATLGVRATTDDKAVHLFNDLTFNQLLGEFRRHTDDIDSSDSELYEYARRVYYDIVRRGAKRGR